MFLLKQEERIAPQKNTCFDKIHYSTKKLQLYENNTFIPLSKKNPGFIVKGVVVFVRMYMEYSVPQSTVN